MTTTAHPRRTVLITGATRGIGRALAEQLAADGDIVLLSSRDGAAVAAAADEIAGNVRPAGPDPVQIHPIQLDATDPVSVCDAAARIGRDHGHLDVLVNNVGGMFDGPSRASTVQLDTVRATFELNLFSAWRVTQAMLPLLRRGHEARIVNVSSETGSLTRMTAEQPAYGMSKAALNALTRSLAGELAAEGITVHAASPGFTATEAVAEGGRPVPDGAASIKAVIDLPAGSGTGGFFQDGAALPW
ncbi:SDR family NAD(P)-dependent oxidoreductase [Flexivirga sp.]|uniref:SDR family NAD(P)-dependent oxidoreductase n=1 Tax=Flexivirga sp. TaxID=1962927 RepID=UPI003F7F5CAA